MNDYHAWIERQAEDARRAARQEHRERVVPRYEPEDESMSQQYDEAIRDEDPCSPNGFGFCATHPTCDHVCHSLKSAQAELERRSDRDRLEAENARLKAERDALRNACQMVKTYLEVNNRTSYRIYKPVCKAIAAARADVETERGE